MMSDQESNGSGGQPAGEAPVEEQAAEAQDGAGAGEGQGDPGANGSAGGDGGANGEAGGAFGGDGLAGAAPSRTSQGAGDDVSALRDRHLRLAAEFDNYRKRVERERSESFVRAQAQLLERLLEPLDDLQRIADFDPATTPATALHEGAEMVERKFLRAFEAAGVEAIDAEGKPFDPTIHEALTTVPAETPDEDNTVAQVYQKGYRLKGVLLRPARVVVKKYAG